MAANAGATIGTSGSEPPITPRLEVLQANSGPNARTPRRADIAMSANHAGLLDVYVDVHRVPVLRPAVLPVSVNSGPAHIPVPVRPRSSCPMPRMLSARSWAYATTTVRLRWAPRKSRRHVPTRRLARCSDAHRATVGDRSGGSL